MSSTIRKVLTRLALPVALLAVLSIARGGVHVQKPLDVDGVDSDGNGTVDDDNVYIHLTAGDGFAKMADGKSMYVFGFADATGMDDSMVMMYGMVGANAPGPTIRLREGQRLYLTLTNVGMMMRPDLFDPHTVHFHGFPNAAPVFDGVPDASISVNMGASLTYFYQIMEPGTFMYHCHVEATEHMQMGMLANLYVLPIQDMLADGTDLDGFTHHTGYKYVYNDGDGSTCYDVEYPIQLSGFDPLYHEEHIGVQPLPFATMVDTYPLMNGRGYPDTVDPNPIANLENGKLSQRVSSLITAEQGQQVLLRLSSLSTTEYYTVTALGIPMKVVGVGARLLRGPDGKDLSRETASVTLGGGEAADVILDTTDVEPGTYFLYTTNLNRLSNDAEDFGGIMTEIVINPTGASTPDVAAILPADGATVALKNPTTFTWSYTGTPDVLWNIEIAPTAADFGDPDHSLTLPKNPIDGTSYALSNGEAGSLRKFITQEMAGSFVFRIIGRETISGVFHRSLPHTLNVASSDLTALSPADGATATVYTPPTFTFIYGGSDLTRFWVELSDRPDFSGGVTESDVVADSPVTLSSTTFGRVKSWFRKEPNPANWTVYWRAVGSSADGKTLAASSSRRIKLDGGTITLSAPANDTTYSVSDNPPVLEWLDNNSPWVDPTGNNGKYVVQISGTPNFDAKRTWSSSKRGTSELSLEVDGAIWQKIDKKTKVDVSTSSATIYWRIIAMDQDLLLMTPSAQTRRIRLVK